MKRFLLRYILRSLRWLVVSFLFKSFVRSQVSSSADKAMGRLEKSAPKPLQTTLVGLPASARKTAGSAMVAATVAKKSVVLGQAVPKSLRRGSKTVRAPFRFFRSLPTSIRKEVTLAKQEIQSDYAREAFGEEAATDVLLDRREIAPAENDIPSIPVAVAPGRSKARRSRSQRVPRVQRSYLPQKKRW